MPQAHGVGKLFWHPIRLQPTAPRMHRYWTQEYEWPYRASESFVVRVWGQRGIVFGWWYGGGLDEETPEYEEHLQQAVQGRTITSNERFRQVADQITYEVRR